MHDKHRYVPGHLRVPRGADRDSLKPVGSNDTPRDKGLVETVGNGNDSRTKIIVCRNCNHEQTVAKVDLARHAACIECGTVFPAGPLNPLQTHIKAVLPMTVDKEQ